MIAGAEAALDLHHPALLVHGLAEFGFHKLPQFPGTELGAQFVLFPLAADIFAAVNIVRVIGKAGAKAPVTLAAAELAFLFAE